MKNIVFLIILLFTVGTCSVYAQEDVIPVIKFKDADIKVVIQSIAQKAYRDSEKVNIVVSPTVEGLVSVNLENVNWFAALEAVLRPYDYGYEWIGETILLVDTLEKIREREAQAKERQEVEPARTKVFNLKYIDAADAKKAIEPILSAVGRVSVLQVTGQAGWEFGADIAKRARALEGKVSRTKTLVVSDISKKLDEVDALLKEIDVMPKQVLIKTKVMEVNRDFLEDIGFDWGTGQSGATSPSYIEFDESNNKQATAGLSTDVTPSIFDPLEGTAAFSPTTAGLRLALKKVTGNEFEAILHALDEDANTNTLSAPSILTLNNQEASILVGTKFPIVKTDISTETGSITGGSLDYYQDIGIQLNVVPQISGEDQNLINMIIHPAVTSTTSNVSIQTTSGAGEDQVTTTLVEYPIIATREAETQVLMKNGETIAIGGLLKDVQSRQEIGVPILSKIPIVGWLFKRHTTDTEKIDLLIFITAKIIEPGEVLSAEVLDTTPVTSNFKE